MTPEPENTPPEQNDDVLTVAQVRPASVVEDCAVEPLLRTVPDTPTPPTGRPDPRDGADLLWSAF